MKKNAARKIYVNCRFRSNLEVHSPQSSLPTLRRDTSEYIGMARQINDQREFSEAKLTRNRQLTIAQTLWAMLKRQTGSKG
jgi:hypothetical protein